VISDLTPAEEKAIRALKSLAKKWPKSLWLFSASGTLHVMKAGPRGEQVHTCSHGGIDPSYSITTVNIQNDGGDW